MLLFSLFAAMPYAGTSAITPQVTSVVTSSLRRGACQVGHTQPSQSAAVRTTWVVSNMDATLFDLKLYQNDVLVGTVTGTSQYDQDVNGSVEYGNRYPWSASWAYRIDVVRKSDGQIVASKAGAAFNMEYGGCSGGGV
jgi:hypothetical protein